MIMAKILHYEFPHELNTKCLIVICKPYDHGRNSLTKQIHKIPT